MSTRRKPTLARATAFAPSLTDHALVRFLAHNGLDVEGVRAAIERSLAAAHGAAIAIGGMDHLITVEGLNFVVRGGRITTVLPTIPSSEQARALRPRLPQ